MVEIIKKYAPKFSIESMNLTYILPIFIALSEMFFIKEEVPALVSINEAVELAKVYGDESSKKIVNGILHKVSQNIDEIKTYIETTEK
jgi:N utilization substance protein B